MADHVGGGRGGGHGNRGIKSGVGIKRGWGQLEGGRGWEIIIEEWGHGKRGTRSGVGIKGRWEGGRWERVEDHVQRSGGGDMDRVGYGLERA